MAFSPFDQTDFALMKSVTYSPQSIPQQLSDKIEVLRQELCAFPEYDLEFFRKRIVRRPKMRGSQGLVFGLPKIHDKHWCFYVVGGDQDQVQLNIGMWTGYIRVGLGFMIGRQVSPKIPAFRVLQTFLGVRPPLPFRYAFSQCIKRNSFQIEDEPTNDSNEIINILETHVIPADKSPVFIFVGALWNVAEANKKTLQAYRNVFLELLPFYEELILAGGRYNFYI